MKTFYVKSGFLAAAVLAAALLACGCGKKVDVKVNDMYTETQMEATVGQTVEEALSEAEISLGKGDQVTPSLDDPIDETTGEITISRQADVTVSVDGGTKNLEFTGKKVGDALSEMDVTLGKHDTINHDPEAYLTDGMSICVIRRVAVSLTADGDTKECITEAKTVEELLDSEGLTLGKDDRVKPKLSRNLKEGTKVVVKRVDIKKITETESIPFGTKTEKSSSMYVGTSKVTRQGTNGKKEVTYKVTYVDGEEESRKAVKEKVIKEPVDKIVTEGTKTKGKTVVSKERVDDCDGSGHGYYIIKYSDGSVEHKEF